MRLNPDCIRDILLSIEEVSGFGDIIQYEKPEDFHRLEKYSKDEVLYHINQCKHNDYFLSCQISANGEYALIGNLSPEAHEFLANIRDDKVWKKVLAKATKVGSIALPVLQEIAAKLILKNI